jgi:amidohydrolase
MNPPLPFSDADRAALIALRRDLHRHPELSWKETATQARLEAALRAFGISDIRRVAETGLVARIRGTGTAATVAVRGDIDALPIAEATGLEFASVNAGVMHACGHDVHASWAVGAARLLALAPAPGDVLVVLQPAEELGEGAAAILESGALDGVGAIFGGHVDRRFEVGQVVAQAGPLAASSDTFHITLTGQGGHGARPHLANDPIVAAAALILDLQTLVSRRLDPGTAGVLTVGSIHGGNAPNVIPGTVELAGTVRTMNVTTRELLLSELSRRAQSVAETHLLRATVRVTEGTPPLENSPRAAEWAAMGARAVLGADSVVPLGFTNMASEDFAFYSARIPACFLRIGAREPGGDMRDVHTPTFAPAEECLFVGAAVLAEAARVASRELSR